MANPHLRGFRGALDKFITSRAFKMTNVGIPLIVGAMLEREYVGIGGRFAVANIPVILNEVMQDEPLDIVSNYLGTYFSYPLSYRCLIGSKVLLGYSHLMEKNLASLTIGNTGRFSMGTGFSFTYRA